MINFIQNNWTAIHIFICFIQFYALFRSYQQIKDYENTYELAMELSRDSRELSNLANKKMEIANLRYKEANEQFMRYLRLNAELSEGKKIIDINQEK